QTDCFNYVRFLQSYNSSHLYACGTYAFQPKCTYIMSLRWHLGWGCVREGRLGCPRCPQGWHLGWFCVREGRLGVSPVHLGCPRWVILEGPCPQGGLGMSLSQNGSSRSAFRRDTWDHHPGVVVPVPAQGDVGGARTLQKKWTSFLKARLVCSAPEQQLHFNRLQAVFTLPGARWQDTAFFGVFQARWGDVDVSAICRYHILEVKKAFEGPYKEYREQAQKWGRYSGEVPSPRPGA
ncbi:SEM4C protein, partial [Locustella ochotensis]|nr:SEM4C protein [Locustella ochotensis]